MTPDHTISTAEVESGNVEKGNLEQGRVDQIDSNLDSSPRRGLHGFKVTTWISCP